MSVWFIYVGGGDTLATTMRWFCLILSKYTEIQDKCYNEVNDCFIKNGKYIQEDCPYLNATMEENFRFRPIGDSLLHTTTDNVEIDGFVIPKGSAVQASLLSVMNDPDYFPEPEKFKPERYLTQTGNGLTFKVNTSLV